MDILYIEQLMVMAKIGIYNWERQCLQKLVFDIRIFYKNKFIIENSYIAYYLDYNHINQTILSITNSEHFLLIEDVAEKIANILINKFHIIFKIQIKINKPKAIHNASNIGVCITRKKIHNPNKIKIYIK